MASEFHCHLFPPSALISVLELLDLPERFWQMSEMWDGGKVWEEDKEGGKSRMLFAMMFEFHQRKHWGRWVWVSAALSFFKIGT